MSVPLQLSIDDGSTTYQYGNDQITTEEPSIETRAEERTLQLSDVKVVVGGGQGGTASLLGVSEFRSLPTGELLRAELRRTDTNEVLLNGAVRTDDIDYDAKTKTFGVRLFDQAQREVWTALGQYYLDELAIIYYRENGSPAPELSTRTTKTTYTDDFEGSDIETWFTGNDVDWYFTMPTVEMALQQLGRLGEISIGTLNLPSNLYYYTEEYTDGNGEGQLDRLGVDPLVIGSGFGLLPALQADQWLENVLDWGGHWLSVEYGAFPSTDVTVEFIPSRWRPPLGGSPTDLNALETPDRYGERVERRDYAIQYAGEIGDKSEIESTDGFAVPVGNTDYFPAPLPSYGTYADRDWSLKPPGLDTNIDPARKSIATTGTRESRLQNVVELDVQLAHIYIEGTDTIATNQRQYTYGQPVLPHTLFQTSTFDTWSSSLSATQETGDPYRARSRSDEDPFVRAIAPVTINGDPKAVHHEIIQNPSNEQFKLVNELWARQPWQEQHLKREDEYVIEGDFVTESVLVPILSAENGATFDGKRWYLREKEESLVDFQSDLRLRRPVSLRDRAALPPEVNTKSDWYITNLEVQVLQDINDDKFVAVVWSPPPAYKGRPLTYDLDIDVTPAGDARPAVSLRESDIYRTTGRLDVSGQSGDHDIQTVVTVYDVNGNQGGSVDDIFREKL